MSVPQAFKAVGSAIGVVGTMEQGDAETRAANMRSVTASENAQSALQQAQAAALVQKQNAKRAVGATTAAYGASGISGESGTALDVLADSASMAERDRQTILYKGRMNAAGFMADAKLEAAAGRNAQTQAKFKAASILVGGASDIYDMT